MPKTVTMHEPYRRCTTNCAGGERCCLREDVPHKDHTCSHIGCPCHAMPAKGKAKTVTASTAAILEPTP